MKSFSKSDDAYKTISEVTKELLLENEHLFQQAREMDLKGLTLRGFFDNIINKYAFGHG